VGSEITVSANSKIELIGADSGITLEGGDITFTTPGTWNAKGGFKELTGGGCGSAERPALPSGVIQMSTDALELTQQYHDAEALAGAPYKAILSDGSVRTGKLDGSGQLKIDGLRQGVSAQLLIGQMPGAYKPKDTTPMPDHKATPKDGDIDALIQKYSGSMA
jgi:type VI secretion system secreted protein VgrG